MKNDPEFQSMYKSAFWSDLFFNWEELDTEGDMLEEARRFKKDYPGCPYIEEWLVQNFNNRL